MRSVCMWMGGGWRTVTVGGSVGLVEVVVEFSAPCSSSFSVPLRVGNMGGEHECEKCVAGKEKRNPACHVSNEAGQE